MGDQIDHPQGLSNLKLEALIQSNKHFQYLWSNYERIFDVN